MPTFTSPAEAVSWLERQTSEAGIAAKAAMLKRLQGPTLTRIKGRAQQKVPELFKTLLFSQEIWSRGDRSFISYGGATARTAAAGVGAGVGGLAAPYAERQHNDTSLRHSGKRPGKYVYRGRGPKQGDPNVAKGRVPSGMTVGWGKRRRWEPTVKLGGKKWAFKTVYYSSRFPSSRYPMVGQHHWLYGRPNSAYEEVWPDEERRIAQAGIRAYNAALRG